MKKDIISTLNAPAAIGPYSQAIKVTSFEKIVFLSGQIPINPETGQLVIDSISEQTEQVMKNLKAVLGKAGMGFENVVKTTIFLDNLENFNEVNKVYAKWMGHNLPARATVEVSALPKGVGVEIDMIAMS